MLRRIPKYRCFKPKKLGLVVIDGTQHYLGKYGSPESVAEYNRLVQEWLARIPSLPAPDTPGNADLTVNELMLTFLSGHAELHYRHADGTPTGGLANFRDSFRPLKELYGRATARQFSPLKLKAVRERMIETGLARSTINQRVGRIVHLFKWAVGNELVPPDVHHGLKAVSGLSMGRTRARETSPVKPVPEVSVDAIHPHVSRQVWAMIELQRLTGARPGEVVNMRTCDLDTSGGVWVYTPWRHKTQHHGRERKILLGPRAQEALRSWLRPDATQYLFSPKEAMAEFREEQRRRRKSPLYPSTRDRPKKTPSRVLRERYSTKSYHHAIGYACDRAGVPRWHPNQLRHNAATRLRKLHGIEVARIILGHSTLVTTQVYAEADMSKALDIMGQFG
jgi:integrase